MHRRTVDYQLPPSPEFHGVAAFDEDALPECSGIYFAWNGSMQIEYVGQSKNMRSRIYVDPEREYRRDGKILACDLITWIECDISDLKFMESYYIHTVKPTRNHQPEGFTRGRYRDGDIGRFCSGVIRAVGCSDYINYGTRFVERFEWDLRNGKTVNDLFYYVFGDELVSASCGPVQQCEDTMFHIHAARLGPPFAIAYMEAYGCAIANDGYEPGRQTTPTMKRVNFSRGLDGDLFDLHIKALSNQHPNVYKRAEQNKTQNSLYGNHWIDFDDTILRMMIRDGESLPDNAIDDCKQRFAGLMASANVH